MTAYDVRISDWSSDVCSSDLLAHIADVMGIPVLAYGLRTDFQGELFEGAARLLAIADALIELKSVCTCGRQATMNLRVDLEGPAVRQGAQPVIGCKVRELNSVVE